MKKRRLTLMILLISLLCISNAKSYGANTYGAKQKVEEVNIKTIFELLPESMYRFDCIEEDESIDKYITKMDYENNYMSMTIWEIDWSMKYWNLSDGRKLVAVNTGIRGDDIAVFFYENGKLKRDKKYVLGNTKPWKLEDFINVKKYNKKKLKRLQREFEKRDIYLYYTLPQEGNTLEINLIGEASEDEMGMISYGGRKSNFINNEWILTNERIYESR